MAAINCSYQLEASSPLSPVPSSPPARNEDLRPTSPLTSPPSTSPPLVPLGSRDGGSQPGPDGMEDVRLLADGPLNSYTPRAGPLSDMEKLAFILRTLRRWRWTVSTLLSMLARHRDRSELREPYREFQNFAYVGVMKSDLRESVTPKQWQEIMEAQGWDLAAEALGSELRALISHAPSFQKYSHSAEPDQRDSINSLSLLQPAIEQHAPRWMYLLNSAAGSQEQPKPTGSHVVIMSILTHTLQPINSTNFATKMGLYLYQGGARRRVMDSMARLGLSRSYKTIHRILQSVSERQRQQVRVFGKNSASLVAYDNYDFAVGRRGERTGDQREHRSIVTALSFSGQNIPAEGLRQSMWRPEIPLSAVSFVQGLKRDKLWLDIRLHLIESAIKALFPKHLGQGEFPWMMDMPSIEPVAQAKTVRLPMSPIMKDESTTSNNVAILDTIYAQQFGLNPDDPIYNTQLRLIYGDLKTVKRILAVKNLRRSTAGSAYDRYDWLMPGLGMWHLRFNLLRLIHHIHWGGGSPMDQSTLQYAADRWGRSQVVEPNSFQALEDLIIHSYHSRIVAWWMRLGKKAGLCSDRIEDTTSWLCAQDSGSWKAVLIRLCRCIHPELPLNSEEYRPSAGETRQDDLPYDEEQQNHINFCAHVEVYLQLKHAIKFADIGLLRRALRECTLMFQAKIGGTPNYGRELLRLTHLTDSPASDIILQRAVLINSLVNLKGTQGHSFETDRLVELLNAMLKEFQSERSIFSKDSDTLLEHWALNAPYFSKLKLEMERTFGVLTSAAHPAKFAGEDTFSMAQELTRSSVRQTSGERFSVYRTVDLHNEGLVSLSINIAKYNAECAQAIAVSSELPHDSEGDIELSNHPESPTLLVQAFLDGPLDN